MATIHKNRKEEMKTPGYLVETIVGRGRTYHKDALMNGKVVVHLLDEEGNPLLDVKGQPKKILVSRDKIKLTGFID